MATPPFVDLRSPTYHSFGREGGEETKSSYGLYPRFEDRSKVRLSSEREGSQKEEDDVFRLDKFKDVKKKNNEYNQKI